MNQFRVLLFARYAELLGSAQVEVSLPSGATAADLIGALRQLPGGGLLPPTPFLVMNHAQVRAGQQLDPAAELALLPPLAGG
ncbi:MAG: MoaD/ThiS family protein [Gemmatimonadota bacterium]